MIILLLSLVKSNILLNHAPGYEMATSNSLYQFEMFIDVHCPDSRDIFRNVIHLMTQKIDDKYIPDLISFKLHFFPLPYHRNSFLGNKLCKYAEMKHKDILLDLINLQFQKLDFYNQSKDLNQIQIQDEMIKDIKSVLTVKDKDIDFIFENQELEINTRMAWKYATTRGVYGAPLFIINGVMQDIDLSTTAQMKELIERMMGKNIQQKELQLYYYQFIQILYFQFIILISLITALSQFLI